MIKSWRTRAVLTYGRTHYKYRNDHMYDKLCHQYLVFLLYWFTVQFSSEKKCKYLFTKNMFYYKTIYCMNAKKNMIKIKMYGKIWSPGMCACNDMCKYNKIRFKCIIAEENFVSFKYLKKKIHYTYTINLFAEKRNVKKKLLNYQFRKKQVKKKR